MSSNEIEIDLRDVPVRRPKWPKFVRVPAPRLTRIWYIIRHGFQPIGRDPLVHQVWVPVCDDLGQLLKKIGAIHSEEWTAPGPNQKYDLYLNPTCGQPVEDILTIPLLALTNTIRHPLVIRVAWRSEDVRWSRHDKSSDSWWNWTRANYMECMEEFKMYLLKLYWFRDESWDYIFSCVDTVEGVRWGRNTWYKGPMISNVKLRDKFTKDQWALLRHLHRIIPNSEGLQVRPVLTDHMVGFVDHLMNSVLDELDSRTPPRPYLHTRDPEFPLHFSYKLGCWLLANRGPLI